MKSKLLNPSLLISFLCILGGAGSLLFGWYPILGAILILSGLVGSLYSIWETERKNKEIYLLLEAQATLFSKSGIGNVYSEAIKAELKKTGLVKNCQKTLLKALEVDPHDFDALSMLGMASALSLSFANWANDQDDNLKKKELEFTKEIIRTGKNNYPEKSVFYDIQGIVYDFEGKHEKARNEFSQSGKMRNDPGWRLLMATSWHMSNEERKGLKEIEEAMSLGAKGWLVDYYYGKSLRENDKIQDALIYLLSAFEKRGFRPELLEEISRTAYNSGYMFKASKFSFFTYLSLFGKKNNKSLNSLAGSLGALFVGIVTKFTRILWVGSRKINALKKIQLKYLSPDEPEFTLGVQALDSGFLNTAQRHFETASQILPEKFEIFANLGICYALNGDPEKAEEKFQNAMHLSPNNIRLEELKDKYLKKNNSKKSI